MNNPPEYCLFWVQSWCMPRSDWASWVQAIGSIAAIGAGAWAVVWQVKMQARQERRRESRRDILVLQDVIDALRHATTALTLARDSCKTSQDFAAFQYGAYNHLEFGLILESLRLTDAALLPGPQMRLAFLSAKKSIENAVETVMAAVNPSERLAHDDGRRAAAEKRLRHDVAAAEQRIAAMLIFRNEMTALNLDG